MSDFLDSIAVKPKDSTKENDSFLDSIAKPVASQSRKDAKANIDLKPTLDYADRALRSDEKATQDQSLSDKFIGMAYDLSIYPKQVAETALPYVQALGAGVAKGAAAPIQGAFRLATGLQPNMPKESQAEQEHPYAKGAGYAFGSMLAPMGAAIGTAKAIPALGRGIGDVALQTATGGAGLALEEAATAENIEDVKGAGKLGAGLGLAFSALPKVARAAFNKLRNKRPDVELPEIAQESEKLITALQNQDAKELQRQLKLNPEIIQAAKELNILDDMQLATLNDNEIIHALQNQIESIPGNLSSRAGVKQLESFSNASRNFLEKLGATKNLDQLDKNMTTAFEEMNDSLKKPASDIYNKINNLEKQKGEALGAELADITETLQAKQDAKKLYQDQIKNYQGSDITGQIPKLRSKISNLDNEISDLMSKKESLPKQGIDVSGIKKYLDDKYAIGRIQTRKKIPPYIKEINDVIRSDKHVTYTDIDSLRKRVLEGPKSTNVNDPFAGMSQREAEQLYGKLSDAQHSYMAKKDVELAKELRQANAMIQESKNLEKRAKKLFGKGSRELEELDKEQFDTMLKEAGTDQIKREKAFEFAKGMAHPANKAISALTSGDVKKFKDIIRAVPKSQRAASLATAISERVSPDGALDFNRYQKFYERMQDNPAIRDNIADIVGEQGMKGFNNVYRISKAIEDKLKALPVVEQARIKERIVSRSDKFSNALYRLLGVGVVGGTAAFFGNVTGLALGSSLILHNLISQALKAKKGIPIHAVEKLLNDPKMLKLNEEYLLGNTRQVENLNRAVSSSSAMKELLQKLPENTRSIIEKQGFIGLVGTPDYMDIKDEKEK